jgi:hypothetical protein
VSESFFYSLQKRLSQTIENIYLYFEQYFIQFKLTDVQDRLNLFQVYRYVSEPCALSI